MLVGPRIFWAPGPAVGPGCYVPVGGAATPPGSSGALHAGGGGDFAALEAGCRRVVDVSEPHVVQFPPFSGGQAATWVGVLAKVQTHWVKNSENRSF